jgi:hypothetical protein
MSYDVFSRLVAILYRRGLIKDSQYNVIEGQVTKFIHILSG